MARVGVSIFSSDTASDYVADLSNQLIGEVEKAMSQPSGMEPDEYYGEVVPCIVEILCVLHKLSGTAACLPEAEIVATWKQTFLSAFEKGLRSITNDEEHISQRMAVISRTLNKLKRLSISVSE